ncbi:hypothetical protein FRC03_004518 [Tulasnella sp. 419]|nr:hypothetical protein FRC03_004518 [Tulasnella sp. 419]
MESPFPQRSVITICYSHLIRNHSLEQLYSPTYRSDENVLFFVQSLEALCPKAVWGAVPPNTEIHLLRLTNTYLILDVLCDVYDLHRLWTHFEDDWGRERLNIYHAPIAFEVQKVVWDEMLHVARDKIEEDFRAIYNTLPENEQEQYAHYADTFAH